MGRYWLGIDIGGTFTDFSIFDEDTETVIGLKVPSTPRKFAQGVDDGLALCVGSLGVDPTQIATVVHGATIAVNTIIQRTGARLGLLVTGGFRDILEIQRLRLPNPFDFNTNRPVPLIPRSRVCEIRERILADGSVGTPLDEEQVGRATRELVQAGVEGIVVAFVNAYRNPAHERRAKVITEANASGIPVTTSSEVWPQAREYERTSLAVMDAYVQSKVRVYLDEFSAVLRTRGVPSRPYITKSNGGIMPVSAARALTASTLLSGPASGVIGATFVAEQAGIKNLITLDVGGTSADIGIVEGGRPRYTTTEHIGDFPVIMPVVGVSSIGAGGGSVVWVDELGVPKVGPQSMGSNPGPACYGLGGKEATLTDAFLMCGFLDAASFLGGRMPLRPELARDALTMLARSTTKPVPAAAESAVRVAVSTMYAEFSKIISKNGIDPREFALVPFGGAGPVVGCLVARELEIPLVFVPRSPGTLCALGAITADVLTDAIRSVHVRVDQTDSQRLGGQYDEMRNELTEWMDVHRLMPRRTRFRFSADMRYVGQSYELEVELDRAWVDEPGLPQIAAAFHREHERMYGHCDDRAPAELVNIRTQLQGTLPKITLKRIPRGRGTPAYRSEREIILDGDAMKARVYARDTLRYEDHIDGPAIVEQDDTTVLIPRAFRGEVDQFGNLLIRREG